MHEDNRLPLLLAAALLGAGCASYSVAGRPADLSFLMQDQETKDAAADERESQELSLQEILARRPTVTFPTSIAVVRLQAASNPDPAGWGQRAGRFSGRFTVVTQRDVETEDALRKLRELPQVSGVAGVNRLLLPSRVESEVDLRKIAAGLHADVLLVYTLDTDEELDYENPLFSLLSAGLLPLHEIEVSTTASAVLLDTRTGYCYGLAESTASRNPRSSFWTYAEKMDDTRQATEEEAFAGLVEDLTETWYAVVSSYGGARPTQ